MLGVLVLGAASPDASVFEPASARRVAAPTVCPSDTIPPDTLTSTVAPGTPLVRPLPPTLNETPVSRYTIVSGPALSGTAGYSFTWITQNTPPGTYTIPLRATHANAPPDTLIVKVTVQSE